MKVEIKKRIEMINNGILPIGYKESSLGIIPLDWNIRKLKSIGESIIGLTYSPSNITFDSGVLVLRSSNIQNERLVFNDNVYVNSKVKAKLFVQKDDILICSRNGSKSLIGKCVIIDESSLGSTFGAFMTVFRSKNSKYLIQLFKTHEYNKQISKNLGATINQITSKHLGEFKFVFPPLQNQQIIANILSTWDKAIDLKEKLIEQKKEQKRGLMQSLLTCKKRLRGFTSEWKVDKLSNLAKIYSGGTPSTNNTDYWNGSIPWATPTDITMNGKYIVKTKKNITDIGLKFSSSNLLPVNSILMCSRATIGPRCINKVPMTTNQGFKSFVCYTDKLHFEFLYYMIGVIKNDLVKISSGSTFLELSKVDTDNYLISFPSLKEQYAISEILSTADTEITFLEQQLEQLKQQKKGLMQLLLTGIVRVTA